MSRIHAIYENGVFRPTQPVELPENCEVEFEPKLVRPVPENGSGLDDLYAILSERYVTGQADLAARHDELDP